VPSVKARRDFLLRVHARLMDCLSYPHDGWALCKCETAQKIRALNERLPKAKRID
jgi:hypothetical protein